MKKSILLIGLLFPQLLFSQKLPIKVYTTSDGLASSFVNSVMCDSRGFVWCSTRNGLSRFDGERFVTYDQRDGLTDAAVFRVHEVRDGMYWIALNNGTACRLLSAEHYSALKSPFPATQPMFEPLTIQVDSETYGVSALYRDSLGEVYVGGNGNFLKWDSSLKKFHHVKFPSEYNYPVTSIVYGRDGSIWFGTSNGIVRYLSSGKFIYYTVASNVPSDWIYSLHFDRLGRLWIGHGFAGVFVLKPEPANKSMVPQQWTFEKVMLNKNTATSVNLTRKDKLGSGKQILINSTKKRLMVISILEASDGHIWLSTSEGLMIISGDRLSLLTSKNGFPDCIPAELSEDKFGNVWVASNNGVIKIAMLGMMRFEPSDDISGNVIHSLYNDRQGRFVAVSGDWYLNYFNGYRFSSYRPNFFSSTEPGWTSNAAFLDKENAWWLLTERGLWRYKEYKQPSEISHQQPMKIYKKVDGLPSDFLYQVYEDRRGNLWISCRGNDAASGVSRFDRITQKIEFLSGREGVPKAFAPSTFCEDSSGNLWIGYYQGGITRYRNGVFTYFSHQDGVPERMITSSLVDRQGRLWIGSNQDGIACLEDTKSDVLHFRYYTTASGLSSNNVRCLAIDLWDRIYIGTVRGVDRLNPATKWMKHYTLEDGLPNEFITCALSDRDGNLWFGTRNGVARMKPDPMKIEPSPPPSIFISSLRIAGIPFGLLPLGETSITNLELQPNQTNVQIEFFSIGRGLGEVIQYQYLLRGAEEGWSMPSKERTVNFANLSAGDYQFEVRAINSEGVVSTIPAHVSFTILPPLTMRWWFRTLMALGVVAVGYGVYRYKVAALMRLERLRLKIASDLHDDVGSALTKIAVHSEIIQNANDLKKVQSSSQLIGNLSREIIRTFSDIVWSIDTRHDTYGELTARMKSFALDVLSPKDVAVEFITDGLVPSDKVSVELRQNIYLIFKEAINNIAKHSSASHVWIELKKLNHTLSLLIRDDGQGIPEEYLSQGHGLRNMKMRAEMIDGVLYFGNNQGWSVELQVTMRT